MNLIFSVSFVLSFVMIVNSLEINWYLYTRMFPGLFIDSKSYSNFKDNIVMIDKHNENSVVKFGITPFLHLHQSQFSKKFDYIYKIKTQKYRYSITVASKCFNEIQKGKYFSWADKGILTNIYNEDLPSWVLSLSKMINSVNSIRGYIDSQVDHEQIYSCSSTLDDALQYISKNPIIFNGYKREDNERGKCIPTSIDEMTKYGFDFNKIHYIEVNSVNEMLLSRTTLDIYSSPIMISMSISSDDFNSLKFYSGKEILTLNMGKIDSINYVGLIVGFGKTGNDEKYWIVNMNLGMYWGNKGTMKLNPHSTSIMFSYQF